MAYWMVKAMVQGTLSLLPWSHRWNNLFQKYVTKSYSLSDDRFRTKLECVRQHYQNYLNARHEAKKRFLALELGTGWHPVVPLGLYLCGADTVWTVDIVSLLSSATIRDVLRFYVDYFERGCLGEYLPGFSRERMQTVQGLFRNPSVGIDASLLTQLNIEVLLHDARCLPLESASVDLFVSNNTLEHIAEPILVDIFAEFKRLAASGAVMSHLIDISDHYANFDRSIGPYNYLQFPSSVWWVFNNKLQYQNRLRVSDYRRIHETRGFTISIEQNTQGEARNLDSISVAREFRHLSRDDLLTTSSWMISVNEMQKEAHT